MSRPMPHVNGQEEVVREISQSIGDHFDPFKKPAQGKHNDDKPRFLSLGEARDRVHAEGEVLPLWEPLLRPGELAALVGESDTGKSLLLLNLACYIVTGKPEFLGMKLHPRHGRVLIVAAEDTLNSVIERIEKICRGMGVEPDDLYERVDLWDDRSGLAGLPEEIRKTMRTMKYDLILIDCFSEVFAGRDENSNSEVRQTLQAYDAIARTGECCVMFLHHITKKASATSPTKHDAKGASSFEQKSRCMLVLTKEESNRRRLSIAKCNHLSEDRKKTQLLLELDEEYLVFRVVGEERLSKNAPSNMPDARDRLRQLVEQHFSEERIMKREELVPQIMKVRTCSERQADKLLSDCVRLGLIGRVGRGKYRRILDEVVEVAPP